MFDGSLFTIIGLEAFYSIEKVGVILQGIDTHVQSILQYHLYFDFAFMAGVYPGIAAACMLVKEKIMHKGLIRFLVVLAFLQTIAWGCDIVENAFLLHWIKFPEIDNLDFTYYHLAVGLKWLIAIIGILAAASFALLAKKKKKI